MNVKIKWNYSPIFSIQTSLTDFSLKLKSFCRLLDEKLEEKEVHKRSDNLEEKFTLDQENLIQLINPTCKIHELYERNRDL